MKKISKKYLVSFFIMLGIIFNLIPLGNTKSMALEYGYLTYQVAGDNNEVRITGVVNELRDTITEVEIPEKIGDYTVTEIFKESFGEMPNLVSVKLPDTIKTIGQFAFTDCKKLTTINLPSSLTDLEGVVFNNCTSLNNIVIPDGITDINGYNFNKCTSLTNIKLPKNLKTIKEGAFESCTSLKEIELPNTLEEIDDKAFLGCSELTQVNIPDSVTRIGNWSFGRCSKLTQVKLSKNLKKIGSAAFSTCISLDNISIPTGVETIDEYTFDYCLKLKKVVLPNTIKTIGDGAFSDCEKLENINIPNSVNKIGRYAFASCKSLKKIYLLRNVTTFGGELFDKGDTTVVYCNNNSKALENAKKYKAKYVILEPAKVTGVTNKTQDKKSITVKWNKISGATDYEVYKYDTSKKKYIKVKTLAGTSFKVTGLKPATTYKFKVRAYRKENGTDYFGDYSNDTKLTTTTKTPSISKLKAGKKKMTVKYKKISGASGYQIQYSTNKKFKSGKKTVNIKKNKTTSTTVKKLKNKKKYYVRIRTYKLVNGKKLYSGWSKVLNVKTK